MLNYFVKRCARALVNITAWEFAKRLFGNFGNLNKVRTIKKK
jgi:hypothetical protein